MPAYSMTAIDKQEMQIKVIVVGSTRIDRFLRNWGISFLIGEDVLFDTFGKPSLLLKQIKKQSIDIAKIKYIVISHDDWDHVSGLWSILEKNNKVQVFICQNSKKGIKERIRLYGAEITEVSGPMKIKEGIYSTGQMTAIVKEETIYEQSLILINEKEIAVITGCSHPGIIEIIREVKNKFDGKIVLLMGGMHLKDSNREKIAKVISELKIFGVEKIAPTHCTGKNAVKMFKRVFNNDLVEVKTGGIIYTARSKD